MPVIFTVMQLIAIIWNINEFMKQCITSRYYKWWFDNPFYCYFASMSSRVLVPTFYILLETLLLFKLRISFQTSFHPLPKKCFYILAIILYSALIILVVALFTFGRSVCEATVYYADINEYVYKCIHIIDGIALYASYYGLGVIFFFNAILGYIFVSKLNATSKEMRRRDSDALLPLYDVMIKNTILALTLCLSTLISWILWFMTDYFDGFGNFFIFVDVFFNCLMIELMYFYNEKWYKLLCGRVGCIGCFRKCYVDKHMRDRVRKNDPIDGVDDAMVGTIQMETH